MHYVEVCVHSADVCELHYVDGCMRVHSADVCVCVRCSMLMCACTVLKCVCEVQYVDVCVHGADVHKPVFWC